jgi:hypothetical protein
MNLSYPLVSRNKTLVRRCGLVTMIAMTAACQQSTGTPAAPTPATVSLSGVVVSQDGSPVPGASTSVRGLDGMNRFTEADGRFTLVEPRTSTGSGQLQVWMADSRVPELGDNRLPPSRRGPGDVDRHAADRGHSR